MQQQSKHPGSAVTQETRTSRDSSPLISLLVTLNSRSRLRYRGSVLISTEN